MKYGQYIFSWLLYVAVITAIYFTDFTQRDAEGYGGLPEVLVYGIIVIAGLVCLWFVYRATVDLKTVKQWAIVAITAVFGWVVLIAAAVVYRQVGGLPI